MRITSSSRRALLSLALFSSLTAISISAPAQSPGRTAADTWSTTVAAAQKEAKVVVYGNMQAPVAARIRADFEKAYPGISLEYTRLASGQMIAKLNQERATGIDGAEIAILTDRGWLEDRVKDGSLAAIAGPNAATWPKASMLQGVIPVLSLETMAIVYNPNLVKTPINGYADLFRPELKGKITTEELVAPVIVAWYEWVEKTMGANYFSRLAELQPGVYGSATAGVQSVAAGEFAVATVINSGLAVPLAKQGLPLRVVNPTPAFGFAFVGGIVKWAKRPNAAQVFMDYLMSVRGQTVWNGQGDSASPLPNIPGSLDPKAIAPFDPIPYTADVVKNYTVKWNALFGKK
jgi:iron(III) transport system substrate-binding protein